MSTRSRWIIPIAAVLGAACTGGTPVRLEVVEPTLTLYGPEPTPIPVRAVNARGDSIEWQPGQVRIATDSALTMRGGALVCLRDGRAHVTVFAGELSATFDVRCRLAESFATLQWPVLTLGDEPPRYWVHANLARGRVAAVAVRSFRVEHPSVVTVQGGRLVARGVGSSRVWVDVGGKELTNYVKVQERIVDDTVAMLAGEFRRWRLGKGRYSIVAVEVGRRDAQQWLYVSTEGARCVRDTGDENAIYCGIGREGGLGVRNVGPDPASDGRRLALAIYRVP